VPSPRKTIAMRAERVEQLHEIAARVRRSATDVLEDLIRKEARRTEVALPGLMVFHNIDSQDVVFGFKISTDGESIPLMTLTPEEARMLARHLEDAMRSPRKVYDPIELVSDKLIDIGRQGVAATLDVILPDDTTYRKSLSRSMVKDVAEWLRAAAKAAESR